MKVYDVSGKLVRNLLNRNLQRGGYKLSWDETDNSAKKLASGLYFVAFKTNGYSATKKLVIAK